MWEKIPVKRCKKFCVKKSLLKIICQIFRDKRQQRRELIRLMSGRESTFSNLDPFQIENFQNLNISGNSGNSLLLVNFTEKDRIAGDEIFLKRLKPNSSPDSAMLTVTSRFIISAFNFR